MSGHILAIDDTVQGRITLRARIAGGGYRVTCINHSAQVMGGAESDQADVSVLVVRQAGPAPMAIAKIKAITNGPVVALLADNNSTLRLALLKAGADDVLPLTTPDSLLLARLRAILRCRAAQTDLHPGEDMGLALGFAEDSSTLPPLAQGQIAILARAEDQAKSISAALQRLTGAKVALNDPSTTPPRIMPPSPDVIVIDARESDGPATLRLLSELRSDFDTRQAMQMVVLSPAQTDTAASALDTGADDVIADAASVSEIAHRCGQLMRRKLNSDRFRDTVHNGLRAAVTDSLTGLYNRRYVTSRLGSLMMRNEHVALLLLDLDHFKQINDRHGHATGDEVLICLADRLRDNVRPCDMVARMGGEEFLIALVGLSPSGAEHIANRIRTAIESLPFTGPRGTTPIRLTASIGMVCCGAAEADADMLIEQADHALYQAKQSGRNRVCIAAA